MTRTREIRYPNGDSFYRTPDGFWMYYSRYIYGYIQPNRACEFCTRNKAEARRYAKRALKYRPA